MKKFDLDLKYIHNKYVMAAAVINCIYTAISEEEEPDWRKESHNYKTKIVIALCNDMLYIMSMNMNPGDFFGSKYRGLESIVDAACFHDIEKSIKDVEDIIKEQIVINVKGTATERDMMQFVPKFNEDKVKIVFNINK